MEDPNSSISDHFTLGRSHLFGDEMSVSSRSYRTTAVPSIPYTIVPVSQQVSRSPPGLLGDPAVRTFWAGPFLTKAEIGYSRHARMILVLPEYRNGTRIPVEFPRIGIGWYAAAPSGFFMTDGNQLKSSLFFPRF